MREPNFLCFANKGRVHLETLSLNLHDIDIALDFREGETSARVRMLRAEKEQRFQEKKVERAELSDYIRAQLELSGKEGWVSKD